MPSPKKPLKRDILKQELAWKLRVPAGDILERGEAATILGKHRKSLSNQAGSAPCFYLAKIGRNGLSLYSRPDLIRWVKDEDYRREMDKLGQDGRPLPWPTDQIPEPEIDPELRAWLDQYSNARKDKW